MLRLCLQVGSGLPEQVREVHAMSRASHSEAQPKSLHLLQGAAPGQTLALEVHSDSSLLGLRYCPHWPHQPTSEAQPPWTQVSHDSDPIHQVSRVPHK